MKRQETVPEERSPYLRALSGPIPVTLPAKWRLSTLADFPENTSTKDAANLTRTALLTPYGTPSLVSLIKPSDTICILIEDLTRTSPKASVLEIVLELLRQIGVPSNNITILIALGTHGPVSDHQLRLTFGAAMVDAYTFVNHDCNADDLVPIGHLTGGTAVKINILAHAADFRLGIGSIFPHPLNGFGGGGKILFPGIADINSIFAHHLSYAFRGLSTLGTLEGNEFHEEIKRLARAGRLDFIVNSVLDNNDLLHQVVAGDPTIAHCVGAKLCQEITSRRFTAQTEVTMISAFPYNQGPQIMKPLAPASLITRPGGTIILYADCLTPLPEEYFAACEFFRSTHGPDLRRAVLGHFANNTPIMPDAPPELNMSMAQTMLAQNDFRIILVADAMAPRLISRLGFIPANDLEEAMRIASQQHHAPTVNIVPAGGVILPIVEQ
jgi:lactate racemase